MNRRRGPILALLSCVLALPLHAGAPNPQLASDVLHARALLETGQAGRADTLLTPYLAQLPVVSDSDDPKRVEAESYWIEARLSDRLPVDSTFRARARAVLAWRERHTPEDRAGRIASMKSAAKLIAFADSATAGEAMLERSLELVRQAPRLSASIEVGVLHAYGQMALGRGDYATAATRLGEAHELALVALGDSAEPAFRIASDLALALHNSGDLAGARSAYESLVESARRRQPGPTRLRDVVQSQLGLALVLRDLNDPVGARHVYEEILLQVDGQLGLDDPIVLTTQQRYAGTLRSFGAYDTALAIAKQVAERRLVLLGPEHTEYAASLGLEGSLLCDLGRFDEAEPKLRESYRIHRDQRGADDPAALSRLNNLGNLARARGNDAAAESLFTMLVAGRRVRLGPAHGGVAEGLYNLALARAWRGRDAEAIAAGLEAADIRRQVWSAIIPFLEERAALQLVDEWWTGHDIAIDVLVRSAKPDSTAIATTWDRVTAMRTLVLDEVARRRAEVASRDSVREEVAWDAWTSARAALSSFALSGLDVRKDPQGPARRDSLKRLADSLERLIANENAAVRAHRRERMSDDSAIRARLPRDAVLVGFVRFPRIKQATALDRWYKDLTDRYAAFVQVGASGATHVVDLGEADVIDSLVSRWTAALALTSPREPGTMARYLREGAALRRVAWDPLIPYVAGARRLYFVPDGMLNRVVWETLPVAPDRFLIDEERALFRLFSERDLAALGEPERDSGLLACGDIAYDGQIEAATSLAAGARVRGARPDCPQFNAVRFGSLPATRDEVEAARRIWRERRGSPVEVLTGTAASGGGFAEAAVGRSFLHVATHGFYVEDTCSGVGLRRDSFKREPLMRCGLIMAGANHRRESGAGGDDGLFTASEVAQLDLHQCECVLLSACGSGLGDISRTEGVFGLQRGFRIAGARAVVMSQWAVDDDAARVWMDAFYRARLSPGGTTASASREASRAVLARLRAAHLSPAPRWWASFMAAGDPR